MSKELDRLETYADEWAEPPVVNAVIDSPRKSRNKFKYDEKRKLFTLSGILPVGAFFPYDFGFVPETRGEDGDALDLLVLMDEPAFVGCLVEARLIGIIEAEQTETDKTERNDRLLAVAEVSRSHREVRSLDALDENRLHEIEHFFVSYNAAKNKTFTPLGRFGPDRARRAVDEGRRRYQEN